MSGQLSQAPIVPLLDTLKIDNIDDSEYFSVYQDYVSNSRLGLIDPTRGGSPKKYFNKEYDKGTKSLSIGSLVHQLYLQPESYLLVDSVNAPTAKAKIVADIAYHKDGTMPSNDELIEAFKKADYYANSITDKKIEALKDKCINYWRSRAIYESQHLDETKQLLFTDIKTRDTVNSCINHLRLDKDIEQLMHPDYIVKEPISLNERTILLDVSIEDRIYHLKAKLDNFTIDFDSNTITVNDLKTCYCPLDEFSDNITRFAYCREMAIYSWLLSLVAKKYYDLDKPAIKSNFLIINTKDYSTGTYAMTKENFIKAFHEFKYLLRLIDYFTAINPWKEISEGN